MELNEILALTTIGERIQHLKGARLKDQPDVQKFKEQWDPTLHRTMTDKSYLPDKKVRKVVGDKETEVIQPVNRIAVPLQKKIVNTAVPFAFGNDVILQSTPDDDTETLILGALNKISDRCKLKSFNRRIYRELLRSTETAEYWHLVEGEESNVYGFASKFKIRVAQFSPFQGDELFPFFDLTGDLVAFSRGFERQEGEGKTKKYFEVFTKDTYWLYEMAGSEWKQLKTAKLPFGKIPIVYACQDQVEWADVQNNIDRLEFLLSKFAETNDYHASPKIAVQGKVLGFAEKGESGAILEYDKGGDIKYLSWDHAPESVKLEIETKLRFIYSLTQTPDISFDSVKGLSSISGIALKMLFMDAHLKVEEKREILDEYLQRRINIQKAIIGFMMGKPAEAERFEVTPVISPFFIDDETTDINNLITATGGKQLMSRRTAIKRLDMADDVEEELRLIEEEEEAVRNSELFDPAMDDVK